ncbi:MAG: hypothetical protein L0H79_10680 [Intrasporangium sp.]|uniref:hypothetical protein n=1 Tax=Intrasporangium sp. TaxID=1925024 RepID=UPI0026485540|nr:hypothetical protein [Intrasporangium sp.]MDN5796199.1 hypothetical protein [Intrasporangium sp.]
MKMNSTACPDRPSPTHRTLRRLAAAVVVVPLLVLGACSGETPEPQTAATTGTTTGKATPTGTTPAPSPTTLKTKGEIKDDVLGHVITPTKVVVGLPWPDNHPVAEEHFELVGVQVKVEAGKRYSASVTPGLFALKTSAPDAVPATNEFKGALGKELGTVKRGEAETGWLIFKVEKGSADKLELRYNRPAYDVKTTDSSIKAKTFTLKLSS